MRVLVLRPQPAAARTARTLVALGHVPVVLPLVRALHDMEAMRAALLEPWGALALTSAEVGRMLADAGMPGDRQRDATVFAVGEATAGAARRAGFATVLTADGTGEALARLVAGHRPLLAHAPLLYLAGEPRSPGFEKGLSDAGVSHKTIACYRMLPADLSETELEAALFDPAPDAVLFYSRESARRFFALGPVADAPGRLGSLRLLCLSANVAAAVPPQYAATRLTAARPDEAHLLDLLQTQRTPE